MNIYEKLANIQQELKAPKNQYSDYGGYYYRSCEDILEGLKPCLAETKTIVTLCDELVLIGERYYVKATATLIDCESGEKVSNTAYARETDSRPKMDVSQITGSASSYARKYALNGLFCIDDVKDTDSDDSGKDQDAGQDAGQNVAAMKINEVKVKALASRCAGDGVKAETILKLYKVENFESLTELQYRNINEHWEEIKKVK